MALFGLVPLSECIARNSLSAGDFIPNPTEDMQAVENAKINLKRAQARLDNALQKSGDNEMIRRKYKVKTLGV